ncbi:MAG: GntR family transcriptional regulator [Actinomycetota bacterium]
MSTSAKRLPRYLELAGYLTDKIRRGVYDVGDDLPTEAQLCASHRVSRFTVREALRRLEEAGLIDRHQGRGSRVVARAARPAYVMSARSERDVLHYATETLVEFGSRTRRASAALVRELALGPHDDWMSISGIRRSTATGRAIAVLTLCIRSEYAEAVPTGRPTSEAIFNRVVDRYGVTLAHIEQTVAAVSLPKSVSHRLGAAPGTPALKVTRRFFADEVGLFEVSVSWHSPHHFEFRQRFEPS